MPRTAILVPAHDNAETLPKVIDGIRSAMTKEPMSLFVVDDCSIDGTSALLDRYFVKWNRKPNPLARFNYITNQTNEGVGFATKAGLRAICDASLNEYFDLVIKLDGDGQHDPEMLPEMIRKLRNGASLVIASRFHKDSTQIATPLDRTLLNRMFAEAIRVITGWQISDARSGFMGMKMWHARALASDIRTKRYGIPMEIILRLWKKRPDAKIEEIPHPAYYGGERLTKRHRSRYRGDGETIEQKAQRAGEAYTAMLRVLEDMKVSAKQLKSR